MDLGQLAKLARGLINAFAMLGVIAYGAAALVTVADIIGRRFGLPVEGVVDLVQLFVVTGAWLVLPFAFLTAAHVSVDFVLDLLPHAFVVPLKILGTVLSLGLLGLMLQQGYTTFLTRTMFGDTSQQLGIPIAWYWYPLLVGMTVSLLAVLLELGASLKQERQS
ncbi:tripartite ATP-independent periplasmic transporter, DctQ component (plasmid) [Pseudosulfitobacter pseudonitzschiae]|uniref:TRAP transporter small permease protein n=1 Tax=Pseudosulfitobacter pseudonitzschiae TaxID=1402135 RepID=A0A221K5Z0_9RHOB|nr:MULTISPECIES: TRAP transporter small permease subunit [Roseobacteraceae]ASM74414.1 tripartite ATP-independent periplasmic transporter, DctQ component [Pseudosulfitobacter pseudonitzschiae]